ncbi:hypothetical protein UFOVP1672_48 [uncultured Caudovirales phage]|uniref:Uncharacterized protein n=1 Tax=uncultured Caudovirales phage TaxID=2100421 RepID=A0A6J5SBV8_9CAUD|nr:hypothetical protein UFOVP988_70 [uncultured Caudovirales phage]CAB4211062.1 hypothetical protein UFOVP1425_70 [uncultured Caudovirales phage]CAB4223433.1 hypothetical protein UFOVP1672_48 [uncultured Caudovirales phage]
MTDITKALETAKRLRALAGKATPAPWFSYMSGDGMRVGQKLASGDGHIQLGEAACKWAGEHPQRVYNLEFIAAARNDTPALCDAVEELAKENERLRAVLRECRSQLHNLPRSATADLTVATIDRALAEKE